MKQSIYQELGIDPHKSSVREIFSAIVRNDFPEMFIVVLLDRLFPGWVKAKHADGDGSKFIQRILHYLETGNESVFGGSVDDALSMNTGDLAAGGFVYNFDITNIVAVGVNQELKKIILRQIALRLVELLKLYEQHGITVDLFGGETADLPDNVRSIVFDMDISSRMRRPNLILGNVVPKDGIWGFGSDGQAIWENEVNSGIMSNGLTMARIDQMHKSYAKKYKFLCREDKSKHFRGRFKIGDTHPLLEPLGLTVSEAIMSPTRQWALVIRLIIDELRKRGAFHLLHGISMNTGGGATKIKHVGKEINYVKQMPAFPPFFQLIQQETGESDENMLTTFNCGIGIDVVGSTEDGILENVLKTVSKKIKIKLFHLGECEARQSGKNEVSLSIDVKKKPIAYF